MENSFAKAVSMEPWKYKVMAETAAGRYA